LFAGLDLLLTANDPECALEGLAENARDDCLPGGETLLGTELLSTEGSDGSNPCVLSSKTS